MGPGEILIQPSQRGKIIDVDVRLFNFEIDVAGPLKKEHLDFLRTQILPAVQANRGASIFLIGSASRSGKEGHNLGLSRRRAEEVQRILAPVNAQIVDSFGRGAPKSGPIEEKHDRAVFMFIAFPTELDIGFFTDDWKRAVNWEDVAQFGALPPAPLDHLNLQVTLTGAPRTLSTGSGAPAQVVPVPFNLEAVGQRGSRWIARRTWQLPIVPETVQPANVLQARYRLSDTVSGMGFAALPGGKSVAVVNRQATPIAFDVENWADHGTAQQGIPSSESLNRIDAQRLMRSGGVEWISLTGKFAGDLWRIGCFVRSPATAFFYSGNSGVGSNASCLSRVGECWISPAELQKFWRLPLGMQVLILAAPNVLGMKFHGGLAAAGPGASWAKLLQSKGGPLTAILGYDDDAPSTSVMADIASSMAERLAGGLSGNQFVDTWLAINANHDGKNTWNAVGMDARGYFWIKAEKPDFRDKEFYTKPFGGNKPVITGPALIVP